MTFEGTRSGTKKILLDDGVQFVKNSDSYQQAKRVPRPVCNMTETPEQIALRIELIVKVVMENVVSILDLKRYRLVSKCWNSEATKEIRGRDELEIRLEVIGNTIQKMSKYSTRDRRLYGLTLHDLSALMQNRPTNFPCTSFSFLRGNLDTVGMHKFLSDNGAGITSLVLGSSKFNQSTISKNTFVDILNNCVPKLVSLQVDCASAFNWNPAIDGHYLSPMLLLKTFVLPSPDYPTVINDTVKEILRVSQNLRELENVHVCQAIQLEQWTHLITSVVDFGKLNRLTLIADHVTFANMKLSSLRSITSNWGHKHWTRDERQTISQAWATVLTANQKTLEYIQFGPGYHPFYDGQFQFPHMEKLKKLSMNKFRDNFKSNFKGTLPSVTHLEVRDRIDLLSLVNLRKLCPNTEHLTVHVKNNKTMDELLSHIFQGMPQLKILQMIVYEYDPTFPNLDLPITGFSKNGYAWVLEDKPDAGLLNLDTMRHRGSWIGQVPGLQCFDLHFINWKSLHDFSHPVPHLQYPMTSCSLLYGLHFLPSCQMNISHHKDISTFAIEAIKNIFGPLTPNVAIVSD